MGQEFDEIKRAISAEQAARYYGLEINSRIHRAKCPFHNGEHENLSFYGGGYRCWVCDASGTSIDFTMNYLGLPSAMDAARRLDRDFNLGLFDKKPTIGRSWGKSRAEETERLGDAFIRWCERKYPEWRDMACSHSRALLSRYNRHTHKEMLSCGRKFALLRHFIISETETGAVFNLFALVYNNRAYITPPQEREIMRLYNLFAADRQTARLNAEELEQSGNPILLQDARKLREVYCLD